MNMKLGHVLAREAGWAWKPKHKSLVKHFGRFRMTQSPEARDPRRGQPAVAQRVNRVSRRPTGNPDNGDAGTPWRRGEGVYGHDGCFLAEKPSLI
jgi:hypothetical protein